MTNIHTLPDAEAAEREACDWIARLNADDSCADDHARFQSWLAASPRHARAYQDLSATWREFRHAGPLVRAVSFGSAMNSAAPGRQPRARKIMAAAAVVGAIALAATWYLLTLAPRSEFQTAIGEHAMIALPDGSTLELNSNSLARIDYGERARIIRLTRGEAFFEVAHDGRRPFWVVAGDSWVRAVGTAFNVYLRPSGIRVTVSEGAVKLLSQRPTNESPSDAALAQAPASLLNAGQQADVRGPSANISALEPAELTRVNAWRRGTLNFENQPLSAVIEELNRYTSLQIVIDDPALRHVSIGGTFQANSKGAEALLSMLQDGFGLSLRRDGNRHVYISP